MNKELEKAAFDYINSEAVKAENTQLAFGDFINGAEWMQKKMIDIEDKSGDLTCNN